MNVYLISLILGIIEGLTEFLPVSSTAHLRVSEIMFGISEKDPFWKAYTIIIQLGAICCVPFYFRSRILGLVKSFPRGRNGDNNLFNHPLTLTLIAFVCTAAPLVLLRKHVSANLENFKVMGLALLVGGVVMWIVDVVFRKATTDQMDRMSLPQAVWIGLVQILSGLFPGTSRSMATISAGQTAGLSRTSALEFSFFLSIPTMFAACGKELVDVVRHKGDFTGVQLSLTGEQWMTLLIGFAVSFLVALLVVHVFMGWVKRFGFTPFAIYRLAIGAYLLAFALGYAAIPAFRQSPSAGGTISQLELIRHSSYSSGER